MTMVESKDTIVAIATPPGRGGVGIVRVSGKQTVDIASAITGRILTPRVATFCFFRNQAGEAIDNGIAIYFPAPASYTGEDVLELHAHGGRVVLSLLVDHIVRLGARLARPGEFTERAFLNGKIDLVQAEAIADLVDSTSVQSARSAVRSLEGVFSEKIYKILDKLIAVRTLVEGALDFSDEDIDFFNPGDIKKKLSDCTGELTVLLEHARQGAKLRQGIRAVIIGKPNAGKSSLLNCLSGRDSAIVTAEPGTTRDTIIEDILIDGIQMHVVDTAGLRDSDNEAETEGIRRALNAAENADIVLFVTVAGTDHSFDERDIQLLSSSGYIIMVKNKIDLINEAPEIKVINENRANVKLSAKTGAGINLLLQHMGMYLQHKEVSEDTFMARERHIISLENTKVQIEKSMDLCQSGQVELLAEELRIAQEHIGEITGAFGSDDLLGKIFSDFCIGK